MKVSARSCSAGEPVAVLFMEIDQHEIARDMVHMFMQLHAAAPPDCFGTIFLAVIANVAGNLPDDYWDDMQDIKPCVVKGCNCHVDANRLMSAVSKLRKRYMKAMGKSPEKTLAE